MNLEDFVINKLRGTKFYDKDNNRFYPYISISIEKDVYTELDIENMVSTFVEQYASQRHRENDYKVFTEHVFDSPGLDIYMTFISYAEYDEGKINIKALTIESYRC